MPTTVKVSGLRGKSSVVGSRKQRDTPPPVVLTFLAPAEKCNQRCPKCLLDLLHEPVRYPELAPRDYARFVRQFLDRGIPIQAITFQGYEVTLPSSWPYLEAVMADAQKRGIRRGFITNGMMLHKWTDRIAAMGPMRVCVSLDGATPAANDPIRGLPGAFHTTVRSIRKFLDEAPQCATWMAVNSCLYDEANFRSLLQMPRLLRSLGIPRWSLAVELRVEQGRQRPAHAKGVVRGWLEQLEKASTAEGIRVHFNDEFAFFGHDRRDPDGLFLAKRLLQPELLYRVWPTGHVGVGPEVLQAWDAKNVRRWNPETDDAVEIVGYWRTAHALVEREAVG